VKLPQVDLGGDDGSPIDQFGNEAAQRRFIWILYGAVGLMILLAAIVPPQGDRVSALHIGIALFCLLSVAASALRLRVGEVRGAITILSLGIWCTAALATISLAGVHSVAMLIFPLVIAMGGWVNGRRWMIFVTALTLLLVIGLALAEHFGQFTPTPRVSPLLSGAVICSTLIVLAWLAYVTQASFALSRNNAIAATEAMSIHNLTLAVREHELQMVMDNVPAAIAAFDPDSRVRSCNARYAALFSSTPALICGRTITEYAPEEVQEMIAPHSQRCLEGETVNYRRFNRDPSGELRIYDVTLVPEIQSTGVTGAIAMLVDVTARVQAEAALRELNETLEQRVAERTQELQRTLESLAHSQEELARSEARATIAALVASVSHELSTPLGNGVMTATSLSDMAKEFIRQTESGSLKRSDLSNFVNSLRNGTDLLLRNLARARDLLVNFKQVAADQASEQRREFDLREVINEIIGTMAPSLKSKPQRIELDVPEGLRLDSYPGPLGQVVINLINNAYLHGFEGRDQGSLRISASNLEREVKLVVADDGVGMDHDTLNKLFQPFFSTKIGHGGTGLGMAIVEGIVRKTLGGSLHVSSELGKGTRFDIVLPKSAP
jgi:PAS domain S-box-containing protein